jgi:hypothetical protein
MKAKNREEYEKAWRSQFDSLASLTLQCTGVQASQLHEQMRDCFETILLTAATQVYGYKEGTLTRRKGDE